MKRSKINELMRDAVEFLREKRFYLPKFAYWTLDEWKSKGKEIKEIIDHQLGWDITDYGKGNFSKTGLIHFTLRNGDVNNPNAKQYCEKVMLMKENQKVPMHHHGTKTEDIINRCGGLLSIELYNTTADDQLAETPISISTDGFKRTLEPGTIITLEPGESITLKPEHYHRFWAQVGSGKVIIGEVSSVNDDYTDNVFLKDIKRFMEIQEDEDPYYLLYDDYEKYLNIE
jgi:hypothetical protein